MQQWNYHRNQQYSIIALTDDSGDILERYSYSAYGDPTFFDGAGSQNSESQISNRFTYTGREWDSVIRLYHYRARMYDPQLGRFLRRDPIGFEGSQWNLYEYVGGQSLFSYDPSGLCVRKCLGGCDYLRTLIRFERIPGSQFWYPSWAKWRCVYQLSILSSNCSDGCGCPRVGDIDFMFPFHVLPGLIYCPSYLLGLFGSCE